MKHISIEIIQKCPNKCIYCSSLSCEDSKHIISINKLKEIVDSAKKLNAYMISLSGGEPFEHGGLLEIVEYIKSKSIKVYVYTSGIMTKQGKAGSLDKDLLRRLAEIKVDKLIFNLPAISEDTYNKIMNTNGYQKFVIESIKKSKELGIYTEIHFVTNKLNIHDIENVVQFINAEGIDKISFLRLVLHGRALENRDILYLDKDSIEMLKIKLNKIKGSNIRIGVPLQLRTNEGCYAVKDKLCIRYDGLVFGCETFKYIDIYDANGNLVLPDSIYDRKLDDIYLDSKHLKLEKEFIENKLRHSSRHENCPVQCM